MQLGDMEIPQLQTQSLKQLMNQNMALIPKGHRELQVNRSNSGKGCQDNEELEFESETCLNVMSRP